MDDFAGKLAVVTGGGSGMGRELCRQLSAAGCHVATCDLSAEGLADTKALCEAAAPPGTRITTFVADVSNEAQVIAFRDHVVAEHAADHVELLFNNAGIGGGGSLLLDDRAEWERTFAVTWGGVYLCTRAFLPLVLASASAHIVNTSSVNGFWASLGPDIPHTAYSTAKFAVKGFTEALITDLRLNAPHVRASVVMPGHIGTGIIYNSASAHGRDLKTLDAEQVAQMRQGIERRGIDLSGASDEDLRQLAILQADGFRDTAPTSAAQAATIILDGVRRGDWRILVGHDALELDEAVRADPVHAYEPDFMSQQRIGQSIGRAFDPTAG